MKHLFLISICSFLFLQSCKDDIEVDDPQVFKVIEISTDFGEMYPHLYDDTPLHYNNFDSLVNVGYYDSTEFHRCIVDFMIQGGSPSSKDDNRNNDGSGGPGYTIAAEIDTTKHKHDFGALAAARTGNMSNPTRRSNGSQFYIVTNDNGTPHLDGEYSTFGRVLAGMDVAKTIALQPQNSKNLPDQRIKMIIRHVYLTQTQLNERGIKLP